MGDYDNEDELKMWQANLDILCGKLDIIYQMSECVESGDEHDELISRLESGTLVMEQILNEMIDNHCGDIVH